MFHVSISQLQGKIIVLAIYYFNKNISSPYSSMQKGAELLEIFMDMENLHERIIEYFSKLTHVLHSFTAVLHYLLRKMRV